MYLNFKDIDLSLYDQTEIDMINEFSDSKVKFKICKACKKYYPLNKAFFLGEKRIKDGFENKCRKCRSGKFLTHENKIGVPTIKRDLKDKFNSNVIELYDYYVVNNEVYERTFIEDNYIYILKYLIENRYKMNDDQVLNISRDWIKQHKFYGILLRKYKGRICDLINDVYPDKFKPWQFTTVGSMYWNDETRKEALYWFIDKLYSDGIINDVNEIPDKVNIHTFNKYSLSELLKQYENCSLYNIINEVYPNKFYEWQYKLGWNFWNKKENRIKALKQLIEYELKINVEDIPKILSYEFFDIGHNKYLGKFKTVISDYYNFNLYNYINECYPNRFKEHEFAYKNHYETLDNIVVKSEPERIIHHILIDSNIDCYYGADIKECFIHNDKGQKYIPDWIIYHNDKIVIVEYYGMLDMNNFDVGYNEKYINKDKYYKELCKNDDKYIYIDLYKEDIIRNISGLKSKLEKIGIKTY